MHAAGKTFVKTYLKAIRDTFFFSICGITHYVVFLSNRREESKLLGVQEDPPPSLPHFLRLVGHPDLPMRETLRMVGLLTVMIFF